MERSSIIAMSWILGTLLLAQAKTWFNLYFQRHSFSREEARESNNWLEDSGPGSLCHRFSLVIRHTYCNV